MDVGCGLTHSCCPCVCVYGEGGVACLSACVCESAEDEKGIGLIFGLCVDDHVQA